MLLLCLPASGFPPLLRACQREVRPCDSVFKAPLGGKEFCQLLSLASTEQTLGPQNSHLGLCLLKNGLNFCLGETKKLNITLWTTPQDALRW